MSERILGPETRILSKFTDKSQKENENVNHTRLESDQYAWKANSNLGKRSVRSFSC